MTVINRQLISELKQYNELGQIIIFLTDTELKSNVSIAIEFDDECISCDHNGHTQLNLLVSIDDLRWMIHQYDQHTAKKKVKKGTIEEETK